MKIVLVIHGYPLRYNAGSEVYTQTLAQALFEAGNDVEIFTREEDPFSPDYQIRIEEDYLQKDIPINLINHARSNARFQNDEVDEVFRYFLERVQPDVVHFGHLGHLSMGLPGVAKSLGFPTIFTLHDFWMMCPRGQFLHWGLSSEDPWKLCNGQEDFKCAEMCFNRFVEGIDVANELSYWESWVNKRMNASRLACENIDLFISPSQNLMKRHVRDFGIEPRKIKYLDYGFDYQRLEGRSRNKESQFVFGYIGRHHPSKGIHDLIDAFLSLNCDARLRIWGRSQGQLTDSLKRKTENSLEITDNIEWLEEYNNENIVEEVFNNCDCIVVPSIWEENSPLVIHEAQHCGIPVITSDYGGMGEYVKDGVNGLTFKHRNKESLSDAMNRAVENPELVNRLGKSGYLYSEDGKIRSKEEHVLSLIEHYKSIINVKNQEVIN